MKKNQKKNNISWHVKIIKFRCVHKKILLSNSHTYTFAYHLWLFGGCNWQILVVSKGTVSGPQSLKYLLPDPLQRKFVTTWFITYATHLETGAPSMQSCWQKSKSHQKLWEMKFNTEKPALDIHSWNINDSIPLII